MGIQQRLHQLFAETKLLKTVIDFYGDAKIAINPSRNQLLALIKQANRNRLRMLVVQGNVVVGDAYNVTHDYLVDFIYQELGEDQPLPLTTRGFIYAKIFTLKDELTMAKSNNWRQLYTDWYVKIIDEYKKDYTTLPLALRRILPQ